MHSDAGMISYCNHLYAKYCLHMAGILQNHLMHEDEFTAMVAPLLAEMKLVEADDSLQSGFLFYRQWNDNHSHIEIPVWAMNAADRKTAVRLFQKLAAEAVREQTCEFSINLYSNDDESIRAFSMLQFGIMSEICIRKPGKPITAASALQVRPLTKPEISTEWPRIWDATSRIIRHLRESPVFYPGNEFTEEMYRDFYMDEGTELIAAFDRGRLAGIIEWNREKSSLLSPNDPSANVGEAYVYPDYRGTGLAQYLLCCAEKAAQAAGYDWLWVQHGTANPNACGFRDKHFRAYQYEMTRTITR